VKNYAATERNVFLSLDVPDEYVMLLDFDAWHYPLNYWYLAGRRAADHFERRCRAAGSPLYGEVPLAERALHSELQQSWQTIFDLPVCRRRLRTKAADQAVQATFWKIHARDVKDLPGS
jgi:hypothetical protein